MQERTKLVLGLTYFDLEDFEQAINFLNKVSSNDENHPRALLGLGWCYLKLLEYPNMINPLETFVKEYPNSEFLPEVYLLLGQAHLKISLYDKSISYFDKILSIFPLKNENLELLESIKNKIEPMEKLIEQNRLDLLLQESKLIETIQLPSKKWIPNYMIEEIKEIEKRRTFLLEQIDQEKDNIETLTQELNSLRKLIQIRQQDWRSHAEYGISRALFLKGQER